MQTVPFVLRDVEITYLNPVAKTFSLVVHVKATPMQMYSFQVQQHIAARVADTVRYLIAEGFIEGNPIEENWKCSIAGMPHPPTNP